MKKTYDERQTLFSRVRLEKGTVPYDTFYKTHPEYREKDDAVRGFSMRMLYDAIKAEPDIKAKVLPLFENIETFIDHYHDLEAKTPVNTVRTKLPNMFKENLSHLLKSFGAPEMGIVTLKESHFYKAFGRHTKAHGPEETYGTPIRNDFKTAIVFIVPMDMTYIRRAPDIEEMIETLSAYQKVAEIGARTSLYLRKLGYDARFESVAYATVPLVPLAYDAGLGDIGMTNHLVNKTYGNAIRLGAVLTDLTLPADHPVDFGLELFCDRCALCLINCPMQSIKHKKRMVNGRRFYHFDEHSCFKLWKNTGTDCGVCLQSCPFSYQIDPETVDWMKNDREKIDAVIKTHIETHGRRPRIKTPLPVVKGASR